MSLLLVNSDKFKKHINLVRAKYMQLRSDSYFDELPASCINARVLGKTYENNSNVSSKIRYRNTFYRELLNISGLVLFTNNLIFEETSNHLKHYDFLIQNCHQPFITEFIELNNLNSKMPHDIWYKELFKFYQLNFPINYFDFS